MDVLTLLQSPQSYLWAVLLGVTLHLTLLRYGEWDSSAPSLISAFFTTQLLLLGFLTAYTPSWTAVLLAVLHVSALGMSKLHLYEEVQALHRQYGDFVRLGPMELSIADPRAIQAVNSAQTPCTKGPWYNGMRPRVALQNSRDKQEHSHRRKVWDRGFGAKSLRDYEPRVVSYTTGLMNAIESQKGTPLNVTDWFNFYSFDVMGDLAFGKSFDMVKNGVKHYFMNSLKTNMTMAGYFKHVVWVAPIFRSIPILNFEHKRFWNFVNSQVDERMKMKPDKPDVFSYLLEEYEKQDPKTAQSLLNLQADAYLIVVAGSDTTAATLTTLFFHLSTEPHLLTKLREHVDPLFESNEVDAGALSRSKHLDAFINETLRLHPPVPSGVQRLTPPEGMMIGDTFVPGNTIVYVPLYTVFRDERNFKRPEEFLPERWTTNPELTVDASVFVPFSSGPYSCIGKQLALMELRYVTAYIVHRYDFALAQGEDPARFTRDMTDGFTLACPPLNLVFTERKTP
ncbi:Tryprostatin B 6-hydroxylase [Fonsecaea pedrosoi]|nr:Tryprostatin B 6-hydroxylase [Fonsecaea pedrosoi]